MVNFLSKSKEIEIQPLVEPWLLRHRHSECLYWTYLHCKSTFASNTVRPAWFPLLGWWNLSETCLPKHSFQNMFSHHAFPKPFVLSRVLLSEAQCVASPAPSQEVAAELEKASAADLSTQSLACRTGEIQRDDLRTREQSFGRPISGQKNVRSIKWRSCGPFFWYQ